MMSNYANVIAMPTDPLKDVFTLPEAARYLKRHPQTLRYHLHETKRLVGEQRGHEYLFARAVLDAFALTVPDGGRQPKGIGQAKMSFQSHRERHIAAARLRDDDEWSLERIRVALGYGSITSVSRAVTLGRKRRPRRRAKA